MPLQRWTKNEKASPQHQQASPEPENHRAVAKAPGLVAAATSTHQRQRADAQGHDGGGWMNESIEVSCEFVDQKRRERPFGGRHGKDLRRGSRSAGTAGLMYKAHQKSQSRKTAIWDLTEEPNGPDRLAQNGAGVVEKPAG